jgi:hypothetical protein
MIWGMEIKSLRITENKIVYKRLFGLSSKEYDFTEITGYKSKILKIKKNQSLHLVLEINSNKLIDINDTLISNISNVEKEIKRIFPFHSTVKEPIINSKDKIFILFVISFTFSFLLIFITNLCNFFSTF